MNNKNSYGKEVCFTSPFDCGLSRFGSGYWLHDQRLLCETRKGHGWIFV